MCERWDSGWLSENCLDYVDWSQNLRGAPQKPLVTGELVKKGNSFQSQDWRYSTWLSLTSTCPMFDCLHRHVHSIVWIIRIFSLAESVSFGRVLDSNSQHQAVSACRLAEVSCVGHRWRTTVSENVEKKNAMEKTPMLWQVHMVSLCFFWLIIFWVFFVCLGQKKGL